MIYLVALSTFPHTFASFIQTLTIEIALAQQFYLSFQHHPYDLAHTLDLFTLSQTFAFQKENIQYRKVFSSMVKKRYHQLLVCLNATCGGQQRNWPSIVADD